MSRDTRDTTPATGDGGQPVITPATGKLFDQLKSLRHEFHALDLAMALGQVDEAAVPSTKRRLDQLSSTIVGLDARLQSIGFAWEFIALKTLPLRSNRRGKGR